jgi:hypothetical protein
VQITAEDELSTTRKGDVTMPVEILPKLKGWKSVAY